MATVEKGILIEVINKIVLPFSNDLFCVFRVFYFAFFELVTESEKSRVLK